MTKDAYMVCLVLAHSRHGGVTALLTACNKQHLWFSVKYWLLDTTMCPSTHQLSESLSLRKVAEQFAALLGYDADCLKLDTAYLNNDDQRY